MFKKLMSFLFEEEEIVEEVTTSYEDTPLIQTIEEKVETAHKNDPVLDKPKSIFVDFNEAKPSAQVSSKKVGAPQKTSFKEVSTPSSKKIKDTTEYEFSSSISPIFGRKEQPEKPVITVQPKIELETTESVLGTIISPIYGIRKGNSTSKKQEKAKPVSTNMSLEDILGVSSMEDETITQLSLDSQETVIEQDREDVLMQLFEEDND